MKIKIEQIRKLLIDILIAYKMPKDEAIILAEDYIDGELQGKHSHGLLAFPKMVENLPYKKRKIIIKKKTSSYLFVDANFNFGAIVGRKLSEQAIKMAKKQGVAIVHIKNMLSWLRPASIAQYIASQNMIGLVVNNGGAAMVAPPGGYTAQIGTNPIGIGIPTAGNDIIVDMATSKRAWGEVKKALANNTDLPDETYFDNKGDFTKDPKKAISVIGSGDYKGFALGLFIEILSGSLVGMTMGKNTGSDFSYRLVARGAMILIINPQFSTDINMFKGENQKLIEEIKHSKKRKGIKSILIPGERGLKNKAKNEKLGYVDISSDLWEKIKITRDGLM